MSHARQPLDRHARPDGKYRHNNADARKRQKHQRLAAEGLLVPPAESIEEVAAPEVQPILDGELEQDTRQKKGGQQPRLPRAGTLPEARCGAPVAPEKQALCVRCPSARIEL